MGRNPSALRRNRCDFRRSIAGGGTRIPRDRAGSPGRARMSTRKTSAGAAGQRVTRRQVLGGALAGGVAATAAALLPRPSVAAPKKGGILRVGATGGGAKDRIDAHNAVGYPDIARTFAL